MTAKITIGLPVYNAGGFIYDCVRSILNQTYKDFILLVVDDGSTDNTLDIIKSFPDERITVISDGRNRGLPYRLNQIAGLCETEYLARMDSDDIMTQGRIEKQMDILSENPDIDVLGGNAFVINEKNDITGIRLPYDKVTLSETAGFIHPTIMAKTSWFRNNFYDEKAIRIEDIELWHRASNTSKFVVTSECLLFYREFGGEYYKKYLKSLPSFLYLAKKSFNDKDYGNTFWWLRKWVSTSFKCLIYYIFFLFRKEQKLIDKRSLRIDGDMERHAELILSESLKNDTE